MSVRLHCTQAQLVTSTLSSTSRYHAWPPCADLIREPGHILCSAAHTHVSGTCHSFWTDKGESVRRGTPYSASYLETILMSNPRRPCRLYEPLTEPLNLRRMGHIPAKTTIYNPPSLSGYAV
ncbi:hypothetical protein J6590_006724 [Homalodisca vitripennis]|nr:hypothetical protein J6590_006724 [Homalodisca vitripennis]